LTLFTAGPKTGNYLFLFKSVVYLTLEQRVTDVSVSIDSTFLPAVNSCRDLGIIVTSDLSPSSHVNSIVAKAHARANAIHRCFVSRNTSLLVRAYLVYVRPLLECNLVIWSPHLKQTSTPLSVYSDALQSVSVALVTTLTVSDYTC